MPLLMSAEEWIALQECSPEVNTKCVSAKREIALKSCTTPVYKYLLGVGKVAGLLEGAIVRREWNKKHVILKGLSILISVIFHRHVIVSLREKMASLNLIFSLIYRCYIDIVKGL